jgi:hypothetical protein
VASIKDLISMKRETEALSQYAELAAALRQLNAEWIVTEVEEILARGKTIPFRALSAEETRLYESRLSEEAVRGFAVTRAKANDTIGVPYEPHERLSLLVDAVQRVIAASELSHSYISRFAAEHGIRSVDLEIPAELDVVGISPGTRNISLTGSTLVNERLSILRHMLYDEVMG